MVSYKVMVKTKSFLFVYRIILCSTLLVPLNFKVNPRVSLGPENSMLTTVSGEKKTPHLLSPYMYAWAFINSTVRGNDQIPKLFLWFKTTY